MVEKSMQVFGEDAQVKMDMRFDSNATLMDDTAYDSMGHKYPGEGVGLGRDALGDEDFSGIKIERW